MVFNIYTSKWTFWKVAKVKNGINSIETIQNKNWLMRKMEISKSEIVNSWKVMDDRNVIAFVKHGSRGRLIVAFEVVRVVHHFASASKQKNRRLSTSIATCCPFCFQFFPSWWSLHTPFFITELCSFHHYNTHIHPWLIISNIHTLQVI